MIPGEKNIWVTIAFVRYIISKYGLKLTNVHNIKDKSLKC